VWNREAEQGREAIKCRHRVISYLKGTGLDLGCGDEKIVDTAIGIGLSGGAVDLPIDMSANDSLRMFSDCYFDYIFSAHCLEDFASPKMILEQWWRLIKPGGHLILYGPDPDFYPRVGTDGCNPDHKSDLYWDDVWKIVKGFGNAKKMSASRHNDSNEYSWLLVVKKTNGYIKKPWNILTASGINDGCISFPRKKKTKKECLVIRYGALGDTVWVTPVLKLLKKQGYHVVYNCTPYSAQVLKECPYVDEFLLQGKEAIPNKKLGPYWEYIGKDFEKVINFSQTIEGALLKTEGSEAFKWSHQKRHKECNVNYMDRTLEHAGFPKKKGLNPELHFSDAEKRLAEVFRQHYKNDFLIEVSLSGSSFHKTYPWLPYVMNELHDKYNDIKVVTVGDYLCKLLENWQHPNTLNKSGVFTVRQSMLLTNYVDLVVGPETGILNAASCYDTPKIVFMSHSSVENLTKYWKNTTSLRAKKCSCQPCHRLIYTLNDTCPLESVRLPGEHGIAEIGIPQCMTGIRPEDVFETIESYYKKWKEKKTIHI